MKFRTRNTTYTIVREGDSATIEGHPRYCPTPTPFRADAPPTVGQVFVFSTFWHPHIRTTEVHEILE